MTDKISLTLPMPPSVNKLYRNKGRGARGRAKTLRYMTWINAAGWDIERQAPGKIEGPYHLTIHMGRRSKTADLGNFEKGISDILQLHGIIENDRLAESIYLEWGKDWPEKGQAFITIRSATAQALREAAE